MEELAWAGSVLHWAEAPHGRIVRSAHLRMVSSRMNLDRSAVISPPPSPNRCLGRQFNLSPPFRASAAPRLRSTSRHINGAEPP